MHQAMQNASNDVSSLISPPISLEQFNFILFILEFPQYVSIWYTRFPIHSP